MIEKLSSDSYLPKYEQLKQILQQKIANNEYKVGELIPSVRQLSKTYNISNHTVIKAIAGLIQGGLLYSEQGTGSFVKEKTKISKQEQPASAIKHIAFVTPIFAADTNHYIKGITGELDPEKYTLSTFSTHADLKKYQQSIEHLNQLSPSGIIIDTFPRDLCNVDLSPLMNSEIPVVAIGFHMRELTCDRVLRSRQSTAEIIAKYINESGLRDLAYISNNTIPAAKVLFNDLKKELNTYNIDFPESRCFLFDSPHGYSGNPNPYIDTEEHMTELLQKGFSSGTLVCGHDFPAVGALRAILKAGLKVPEDIAIISAKSSVLNGASPMDLTTVDAMHEQQGRMAAKLLIRRIEGYTGTSEIHHITGKLIRGETA